MDEWNGYVIFAGVVLMLGVLAYAGFTDLVSRIRPKKNSRQRLPFGSRRRH
jgi:hypothetical protein